MSRSTSLLAVALVAVTPMLAHAAGPTQVVIAFDFSHAVSGTCTTGADYQGQGVTAGTWNCGDDGTGSASIQNSGSFSFSALSYFYQPRSPSMTFTTSAEYPVAHFNFYEASNHNYPFDASYRVQVLLDGHKFLQFVSDGSTFSRTITHLLPDLVPGTHTISFVNPSTTNYGTNSDYFMLRFVSITSP